MDRVLRGTARFWGGDAGKKARELGSLSAPVLASGHQATLLIARVFLTGASSLYIYRWKLALINVLFDFLSL
jgi:hypothetical protein